MLRVLLAIACIGLPALPASAGMAGVWLTPPDNKAQTGHVEIRPCGAALCGVVIGAFDRSGQPIVTPAVGQRILWDLTGSDARRSGRVYVPLMRAQFPVQLTAQGNRLNLKACNAVGICRTQVWQRVR